MGNELCRIIKLRTLLDKNPNEFVVTPGGQLISVANLINEIVFESPSLSYQTSAPKDLIITNDIIKFIEKTEKNSVINEEEMSTYANREALYRNFEKLGRRCLAGGTESVRNKYTAHHDDFERDGGRTTVANISPLLCLEHSAIHALANESYKYKRKIYDYFKEIKSKRQYMESVEAFLNATENEVRQFHSWLEEEMVLLGFEPTETKNNTLIYKRADTRNRPQ